MNLKITKKAAVIFISVMLFFTFTSGTIHYLMVPKVTAEAVIKGKLIDEYRFSSGIEGYFLNRQPIYIEKHLDRPLYIKEIHVENDEYENKKSQIDFMKSKGIINQQSIFLFAERVEKARDTLAALEKFEDDFQLTSPSDGIVKDLEAQHNKEYRGMDILGYIVDISSEQGLKVKLDKKRDTDLRRGMRADIDFGSYTVKGQIYKIIRKDEWHMIIKADRDISNNIDSITNITIKTDSPDKDAQLLIPCSALIQASSPFVYLLMEKKTFFGKEYYVQKVDTTVIDSNDKYIAVDRGITPNDIVVTGWDRALNDGDVVELQAGRDVR